VKKFEPGRTLVLGTGYVAAAYMRALHFLGLRPIAVSRSWLDYTREDELDTYLRWQTPQLVINAAGFTGRTVDDCEADKQTCYTANVTLPRIIGQLCKLRGIPLIHISSGCIFTGEGPFTEESMPNNLGQFYAQCKLHAELELADTGAEAWVFRIRMPFGHVSHQRNLLVKLAGYERVLDGLNSITFLDEFAMRSYHLVQTAEPGVYHAACSNPVRTAHVARLLLDAGLRKLPVTLYPADEFNQTHVPRSAAVLDVTKFERAYGQEFGDPLTALKWSIDNFGVAKFPQPEEPYGACKKFSSPLLSSWQSALAARPGSPPPTKEPGQ
jgi:dTDP-4-dehydrorhamnose reductase